MKCQVCRKRISHHADMCPYCGARIEQKPIKNHPKPIHQLFTDYSKKLMIGFALAALLFAGVFLTRPLRFYGYFTTPGTGDTINRYLTRLDGMTFDEAIKSGYDDDSTLKYINEYKVDLIDYMKNHFEDITIEEECQGQGYTSSIKAILTIHAVKDNDEYVVKAIYKSEELTQASLNITGTRKSTDNTFDIKENAIGYILDYLKIDNGYQLLNDGYSKMSETEDNQYKYQSFGQYTVTMTKDINQTNSQFSYGIGY